MMTKLKWNELDMNSARFVSIDDDQVEIEWDWYEFCSFSVSIDVDKGEMKWVWDEVWLFLI
jgi:hypothetical protein